jgi:signal transduction histidine kinase
MDLTDKNTKYKQEETEALKSELIAIKEERVFQKKEKIKRAAELEIANKEVIFEKEEKTKRAAELLIAKKEQVFQKEEKKKRAAELVIANKERVFQKEEKKKRAAELAIANKERVFQKEEKKKRAAELVIANKELVFQNKEKTKRAAELEIANKELVFQNKEKTKKTAELELANRQLIDFCNIVSHNLRAPLVNIAMLVDCMQESKDVDEREDLLKKTKLVTNHLNEVFNELVESIQIKRDTEIQSEKIILKDCLDNILTGFVSEIETYKADIQINFNDVHVIHNSRKYMESIFTNLISNTLKYKSPDRKPVVQIKFEKINGSIIFSVSDNGLGIDLTRHQDNLFKIRKTFHKHKDAKGFGLYLVKTQVEAIGGKIWATSIPNIGSSFFVEFKTKVNE